MSRHLILDPRPHLVGIDKWQRRTIPFRPTAQQQPLLVVQRIDALRIRVVVEVVFEVVAVDGRERLTNALRLKQMAEADDVREPLPQHLIGKASRAVLVTDLIMAILRMSLSGNANLAARRNLLNVIVAIPQLL